jgi:hypothetical protein
MSYFDELFTSLSGVIDEPISEVSPDKQLADRIVEITKELESISAIPIVVTRGVKPISAASALQLQKVISETNILNEDVRAAYIKPISIDDTRILTRPLPTTTTISGILANVNIDDKDIEKFEPNESVVIIESNFGRKVHPSYFDGIVEKVKSSRGRKPKPKKVKKERKKQGSGKCFNSQVTFIVRTDIVDKKSLCGFKEYKFKIFRGNKEQLPGCTQKDINSVLIANYDVLDVINAGLHPNEQDETKKARLVSLNPSMKNYKFYLKMNHGQLIDLITLKRILLIEKLKDSSELTSLESLIDCTCKLRDCDKCFNKSLFDYSGEMISTGYDGSLSSEQIRSAVSPKRPKIFDVKYTYEDTKLSLKFSTPIPTDPNKRTRINIFPGKDVEQTYSDNTEPNTWGGKINILGALYEETTKEIYEYLLWLFELYYDQLVVDPAKLTYSIKIGNDNDGDEEEVEETPVFILAKPLKNINEIDNIFISETDEEIEHILYLRTHPVVIAPELSIDELSLIEEFCRPLHNLQIHQECQCA